MPAITLTKAHNLSQLHDEILAAFPALAPTMRVEGSPEGWIRITLPDDADEAAVRGIIQSHTPRAAGGDTGLAQAITRLKALPAGGDLSIGQASQAIRDLLTVLRTRGLDA